MVTALIGSQSCVPPGLAFNSPGAPSKTAGLGIVWAGLLKEDRQQRGEERWERGGKGKKSVPANFASSKRLFHAMQLSKPFEGGVKERGSEKLV